MKFRHLFALVMVVALAVPTLSGAVQAQEAATITVAFAESQPNTLDIHAARTTDENLVMFNVCDGLTDTDPATAAVVPGLAESWEVSPDGLVYTFKLRSGVTFPDGSTLDAADVKYTFDRFANPKFGTSYVAGVVLRDVVGWAQARPTAGKDTPTPEPATSLSGVEVVDDLTVKITLSKPVTSFLVRLTMAGAGILAAGSADSGDFSKGPMCAGPYRVEEFVQGDRLVLVANENYYKGAPKVKRVVIRVIPEASTQVIEFEAGNLDMAVAPEADLPRIRSTEALAKQLVEVPTLSNFNLRINLKGDKTNNVLVRRALSLAIDRKTIVETVLQGQGAPAYALYPPGLSAYDKDYNPFPYDPEAAKKLLAEAGYPNGIELTVRNDVDEVGNRVLNAITQSAAPAGIKFNVNVTEASVYTQDRNACTMEMGYIRWTMDYPDPENMVTLLLPNAATRVNCGYGEVAVAKQIDELYNKAISMPLGAERDSVFREIEKIAMDEVLIIPIFHRVTTYLVSSRLGGTPVDSAANRRFDLIDLK